MLNSVCMSDKTGSAKKQSNIYIVHPSHAAVTHLLSMIMLVVLLWLSVMTVAAIAVCVAVCGYRIIAPRPSVAKSINTDRSNSSGCVKIANDGDDDNDGDYEDDDDNGDDNDGNDDDGDK